MALRFAVVGVLATLGVALTAGGPATAAKNPCAKGREARGCLLKNAYWFQRASATKPEVKMNANTGKAKFGPAYLSMFGAFPCEDGGAGSSSFAARFDLKSAKKPRVGNKLTLTGGVYLDKNPPSKRIKATAVVTYGARTSTVKATLVRPKGLSFQTPPATCTAKVTATTKRLP